MNKEIVIHVVLWVAASAVIYVLWKKNSQTEQPASQPPWATVGVAGSGNAGWSGAGNDSPDLPPTFTFN